MSAAAFAADAADDAKPATTSTSTGTKKYTDASDAVNGESRFDFDGLYDRCGRGAAAGFLIFAVRAAAVFLGAAVPLMRLRYSMSLSGFPGFPHCARTSTVRAAPILRSGRGPANAAAEGSATNSSTILHSMPMMLSRVQGQSMPT